MPQGPNYEIKAENAEYIVEPCVGGRWKSAIDNPGVAICTVCLKDVFGHCEATPIRRIQWSSQLPAKKGWYWYRPNDETRRNFHAKNYAPAITRKLGECSIVRVDEDIIRKRLIVRFPGTQHSVDSLAGEWAGPLQRPWRGPGDG